MKTGVQIHRPWIHAILNRQPWGRDRIPGASWLVRLAPGLNEKAASLSGEDTQCQRMWASVHMCTFVHIHTKPAVMTRTRNFSIGNRTSRTKVNLSDISCLRSAWDMGPYLRKLGRGRRQKSTLDKAPLSQWACVGGHVPTEIGRQDRKEAVSRWPPTPGETSTTCLSLGPAAKPVWNLFGL